MGYNVTVAAYDGMLDSLRRFDRSMVDIARFLCDSSKLACELLNEDDTALALNEKVTKIAGKMATTLDQTEVMRKALQKTRDELVALSSRSESED